VRKTSSSSWQRSAAQEVVAGGEGWQVLPLHTVTAVPADIVVFATGNEPPTPLGTDLPAAAQRLVLNNPWQSEALNELPRRRGRAHRRHGPQRRRRSGRPSAPPAHRSRCMRSRAVRYMPRAHGDALELPESLRASLPTSLRALVKRVRELSGEDARADRWRGVMLQSCAGSRAAHLGCLGHLRSGGASCVMSDPSGMCTVTGSRPKCMPSSPGRSRAANLSVVRGRLESARAGRCSAARCVPPCDGAGRAPLCLKARRSSTARARQPTCGAQIIRSCAASSPHGHARPDALSLGLATDERFHVCSRTTVAVQRTLYALGPLARGRQWELTAPYRRFASKCASSRATSSSTQPYAHDARPKSTRRVRHERADGALASIANSSPCKGKLPGSCGFAAPLPCPRGSKELAGRALRRGRAAHPHHRALALCPGARGCGCDHAPRPHIYLSGSAADFFANPALMLHEFCHVLLQWETGRLTSARYVCEWLRRSS
jgi:hypothetical protein